MCTMHIATFDTSTIMFLIMQFFSFVNYVNYNAIFFFCELREL
jgi:hypothetical protein